MTKLSDPNNSLGTKNHSTINPYESPKSALETTIDESQTNHLRNNSQWYSFSGRIGRLRYLSFNMLNLIIYLVFILSTEMIFGFLSETTEIIIGGLNVLAFVFLAVYLIVHLVRRLNDIGHSGWLGLIILLPIIGNFFILYVLIAPGEKISNRYGYRPKDNGWYNWACFLLIPIIFGLMLKLAIPVYDNKMQQMQFQPEQSDL